MVSFDNSNKFTDFFIITITVVGALFIFPFFNASQYATNIVIPIAFIYFYSDGRFDSAFKNESIKLFLFFVFWSIFTSLFAKYYENAWTTEKKKVLVFIYMMTVFAFSNKNIKNSIFSIKLLILVFILVIIYSFFLQKSYVEYTIREIDDESGSKLMDSNGYGYFIFIGISAAFVYFDAIKNSFFYKILLLPLILISFNIILSTASRGSYLIFLMLIFCNVLISIYFSGLLRNFKILIMILIAFSIPLLLNLSSNLIVGTQLEERFDRRQDAEGTTREMHLNEAIKVGFNNPILGVGGGNYSQVPRDFEQGSFSHNSYAEAFANYGFLGLILLLIIYGEFLYSLRIVFLDKRIFKKKIFFYLLSFLITFMAYNIFYVTYLTIEFMGAFIIMRVFLTKLYNFEISQYYSTPKIESN
jgi:hypothetical protein